jgi:hypothetical protein
MKSGSNPREFEAWRLIVKKFDYQYGLATAGKADYRSEPIKTKILRDFYRNGVAFQHLGNFMTKYQEFDHFVNKFFQMKNKISPPKKRKPPYKKVEEDGQGILF